jgi:hypothetical protein
MIPWYWYQVVGMLSPHFPANGGEGVVLSVVSIAHAAHSTCATTIGLCVSESVLQMATSAGCSIFNLSQPSVAYG